MKKILIALISVFSFNAWASNPSAEILQDDFKVTLQWLDQKPKSYSRDFFIIQFLNQKDTSPQEAKIAYDMARKKSSYITKAYKKFRKTNDENIHCYRASINELLNMSDEKCVALGLSLKEASKLSKGKLKKFISKINNYPTLKRDLQILLSRNISSESLDYGYDKFFKFFFKIGYSFRVQNYNKNYSESFINKLANQKDFELFTRYIIYDENNLKRLQNSLLKVNENRKLTANNLFLLGLNAINLKNEERAFYFFEKSYKKAYLQSEKDKALFWLYLVSDNKSFLHELSKSWDINIYSAYSKELYDIPLENLHHEVEVPNLETSYDIYDQFSWLKVMDDTKKNLDENKLNKYKSIFTSKETIPHLTFVLTRYHRYRNHYYITPYEEYMKNYSTYKKVLINSIARQESLFIPSSISVSTAQGVMQIMPFLSEDIAKRLNDSYNIYEQFNAKKNIEYGSFHLNTLMKQFNNNPLFIAYAYNGGAGYTKKQFKRGLFERIDKKYEPFLSMEMISYPETREYGKKVLTNYYIYNNYLNSEDKIKLSTIFQTLVVPH